MIDEADTVAAYNMAAVPAPDMVGVAENVRFFELPVLLRDCKTMRIKGRMKK